MIHLEVGDVSEDGINEDPKYQSKSYNGQQSHHLGHVPLEEALILVDNQPDTPGTPSSWWLSCDLPNNIEQVESCKGSYIQG